jgi:hypothetical protein
MTDPEFDRPDKPQSGDRLPPGCVTASEVLEYWQTLEAILSVLSEEECLRIAYRLEKCEQLTAAQMVRAQGLLLYGKR